MEKLKNICVIAALAADDENHLALTANQKLQVAFGGGLFGPNRELSNEGHNKLTVAGAGKECTQSNKFTTKKLCAKFCCLHMRRTEGKDCD